MIALSPEQRAIVEGILRRHVPEAEVRVFGSRAAGTEKKHSDLDLAILAPEPIGGVRMALLEEDFRDSDLPFRVDVLDWADVSAEFRVRIETRSEVILQPQSQSFSSSPHRGGPKG